jgi:hypothetical protein
MFKGSFGTVILQLPVKGGHEGGRFKVKYRGKEQVYENHKASDRCFYVTSFYGNSAFNGTHNKGGKIDVDL